MESDKGSRPEEITLWERKTAIRLLALMGGLIGLLVLIRFVLL